MNKTYLLIAVFCITNSGITGAEDAHIPQKLQDIINNQLVHASSFSIDLCKQENNIIYKIESNFRYGQETTYFDSDINKIGESNITTCYEDKTRSKGTIPDVSKFDCKNVKIGGTRLYRINKSK